jgi:DNA processing protein
MYIQTKTLVDEFESRLILFSVIEPGQAGWSAEIQTLGASRVLEGILAGDYNPKSCGKILEKISRTNVDMLESAINASNSEFIYPGHSKWPAQIDQLSNPPIGLVVKGDLNCLNEKSIAVIGTREPSDTGLRNARSFSTRFAEHNWHIVSGGAVGIDSAAHSAALRASGKTIAVIASGVEVDYPPINSELFKKISAHGALVSEVMPHVRAQQNRFLTRNRLIAALSCATLVVEAAYRSGSLRTARDAAELMRPVLAIPGPLESPKSEGCHRLIAEHVAEIVVSEQDAMEFVGVNQ